MSHSHGAFLHNIQRNCIGPNQDLDQDMGKGNLLAKMNISTTMLLLTLNIHPWVMSHDH